jgi:hypothetical protein
MVVLLKGGVVNVPDRASGPLQPPAPIQAEVFVDDHVNTEVKPIAIEEELALKVSAGAGIGAGVVSAIESVVSKITIERNNNFIIFLAFIAVIPC